MLGMLLSIMETVAIVEVLLPVLKEVANLTIQGLKALLGVIEAVAEALGIIAPDDLGDRALQAEEKGITLESCGGDYDKYLKQIEEFELDPEKSAQISEELKTIKALAVLTGAIDDRFDFPMKSILPIIYSNPEFFNSERVKVYMDTFKASGMSLENAANYFDGTAKFATRETIENMLLQAEKAILGNIGKEEQEIRESIRENRA